MNLRKLRRYVPFITTGLVIVAVFLFLRNRNGAVKVEISKAEVRTVSKIISASGSTGTPELFTVRALLSGSIKEIKFSGGDRVKKDEIVLEFEPSSLKSALDTAYSSYLASKASAQSYDQRIKAAEATESARRRERDEVWRNYMADDSEQNKIILRNAEALYQTAVASLTALREEKAATESTVSSSYSTYYAALRNYQNTIVKAPTDGQLALSGIYQGSFVTAGQELFSVINSNGILFRAEIDEADIGNIKPGMKVKLNLDSYPGKVFDGTVRSVDAKVVILPNGSTAVMSDITFDNPEVTPIKGLNGSADIEVARSDETISISPDAIFEEAGKNYVYVITNGTVHKVEVTPGFEGDDFIGVSGLNNGDVVVSDPGTYNLKDGQRVNY